MANFRLCLALNNKIVDHTGHTYFNVSEENAKYVAQGMTLAAAKYRKSRVSVYVFSIDDKGNDISFAFKIN